MDTQHSLEEILSETPTAHFAILGASHNISDLTQDKVDEKIRASAEDYRAKGDMVSYKYERVRTSKNDELKFLASLDGIPLLCYQLTSLLMQGVKVAVVGSSEVGLIVQEQVDYLGVSKENVVFVHEGKSTSFGNTLSRGTAALRKDLRMEPKDSFYFIPADLPFFFNTVPLFFDKDMKDAKMLLDFNAREQMFPDGKELFPRNYYWRFKDNSKRYAIKEPGAFGFSASLHIEKMQSFFDGMYANRQAGALGWGAIIKKGIERILGEKTHDVSRGQEWKTLMKKGYAYLASAGSMLASPEFYHTTATLATLGVNFGVKAAYNSMVTAQRAMNGAKSFKRKDMDYASHVLHSYTSNIPPGFDRRSIDYVGPLLFGGPVIAKAEHHDPFRVKDVDAWHDLWYYANIIKENGGLDGIYPYAKLLEGFKERVQSIQHQIGILQDFPAYANMRAEKLGMPQPFNAKGELIIGPAEGEDIQESIRVLRKAVTLHISYEAHRLKYAA
ncbi:hypothetical protein HZB01_00605 [Candidatus Woesearchaeota archaeon]|nr:hypothetical protein [Candidatus Woesearchaeota archaeon]